MDETKLIGNYLEELRETIAKFDHKAIGYFVDKIREAQSNDKFVYIFGNGGCTANSMHFCCDMDKGMLFDKNEKFKIVSLNENIPIMTAWANDSGYEDIFWRQLETFMREGDLIFALSGSGNSKNVIKAVDYASSQGNMVVALSGFDGGKLAQIADFCYVVPSQNMQIVEDAHGIILHSIYVSLRDS